jgi:hypothetical protein
MFYGKLAITLAVAAHGWISDANSARRKPVELRSRVSCPGELTFGICG